MTAPLFITAMSALLTLLLASSVYGRTFTFENKMPFTVWVGSLGNAADPAIGRPAYDPIDGGGWEMAAGSVRDIEVQEDWGGRFWARTGCNFDGDGNGHCQTGDCGNKLKCAGAGGEPPVTLVEITMKADQGQDSYDVSLVDGSNMPASITPTDQSGDGQWCNPGTCPANLNENCPPELRVEADGQIVSCKSACLAFSTDEACCRNAYNDPNVCGEDNFSQYFKQGCPKAYSYAYDDPTGLFACRDTNYRIVWGA